MWGCRAATTMPSKELPGPPCSCLGLLGLHPVIIRGQLCGGAPGIGSHQFITVSLPNPPPYYIFLIVIGLYCSLESGREWCLYFSFLELLFFFLNGGAFIVLCKFYFYCFCSARDWTQGFTCEKCALPLNHISDFFWTRFPFSMAKYYIVCA